MDLRQIEYVIAIADNKSITKAAESLFITQSGLNQQLIKLEKELGTQLFYRDKHRLRPTQAGAIYIRNARSILNIKKSTYLEIEDLLDGQTGEITLGVTPEHGIDMLVETIPRFNQKFPGVTLNLKELYVNDQHRLLQNGQLDLGFVILKKEQRVDLEYIHLCNERMVLGIPQSHPLAQQYAAPPDEDFSVIDLALFRDEKFSMMFKDSTLRSILLPCFEAAGFQPKIFLETGMNHVLCKMVSRTLCCTIIPQSQIVPDEKIAWFYLTADPHWEMALAYNRNSPPGKVGRYLIEQAQLYGKKLEKRMISTHV